MNDSNPHDATAPAANSDHYPMDEPSGDLADFFAEGEAPDSSMEDGAAAIGRRITEAREALDDSIETLAERLGVTADTVEAWESGDRPLRANHMTRVSGVLGISLSWLIMGRGIEPMAEPTDLESLRSDLSAARSRLDDIVNELAVLDQRLALFTTD
ncbi:MAG: multiprotein-bridging factor 1 family protein [Ilumatobacter sp.]